MNAYEKKIDSFLELILKERYESMKIDRTFKYKKPTYSIVLDTSVDYSTGTGFSGISFSLGSVGVYISLTPHRNEIFMSRDDSDGLSIESIELTDKYSSIIETLYHKKMNDNVIEYIDTTVDYLELKEEFRNIKIKSIIDEK